MDATAETGLHVSHVNGMSGQFYYPEIIAPGVALLDYDNDGSSICASPRSGAISSFTARTPPLL